MVTRAIYPPSMTFISPASWVLNFCVTDAALRNDCSLLIGGPVDPFVPLLLVLLELAPAAKRPPLLVVVVSVSLPIILLASSPP